MGLAGSKYSYEWIGTISDGVLLLVFSTPELRRL